MKSEIYVEERFDLIRSICVMNISFLKLERAKLQNSLFMNILLLFF